VALARPSAAAAAAATALPDFGGMLGLSVGVFFKQMQRGKKSKPVPKAISECAD
jgi:hypothetical protein